MLYSLNFLAPDISLLKVYIDNVGQARLADAGITSLIAASEPVGTESNGGLRLVGTHGYLCPIYAADGVYRPTCDAFSAGVVLLRLLTSQPAVHPDPSVQPRALAARLRRAGPAAATAEADPAAEWPAAAARGLAGVACRLVQPEEADRIGLHEAIRRLDAALLSGTSTSEANNDLVTSTANFGAVGLHKGYGDRAEAVTDAGCRVDVCTVCLVAAPTSGDGLAAEQPELAAARETGCQHKNLAATRAAETADLCPDCAAARLLEQNALCPACCLERSVGFKSVCATAAQSLPDKLLQGNPDVTNGINLPKTLGQLISAGLIQNQNLLPPPPPLLRRQDTPASYSESTAAGSVGTRDGIAFLSARDSENSRVGLL